mgnify:CR=1 FL=1|jgi:hypothetical protein
MRCGIQYRGATLGPDVCSSEHEGQVVTSLRTCFWWTRRSLALRSTNEMNCCISVGQLGVTSQQLMVFEDLHPQSYYNQGPVTG